MRKVFALALAAALSTALLAAPAQAAAKRVTLRVGNNQPDSQAWNIALKQLKDKLKEYSDGSINLALYPNATLGAEPEMAESVKEGSLDMFVGDPTVGTTFCKELELGRISPLLCPYRPNLIPVAISPCQFQGE